MKIGYLHLEFPINGKKKILDKDSFINLYLKSDKTIQQICDETDGVYYSMLHASLKYYRNEFDKEIEQRKRNNYSKYQSKRPEHQNFNREPIKLNKKELDSMILDGKTEWQIAKELQVAPQTIRKNVRSYKLKYPPKGLYRLNEKDWLELEKINEFAPGLIESAYEFLDNPYGFFLRLYTAFVEINKLLWIIQKYTRRYSFHRQKGNVPKNFISWRQNKHEILVSERLRELDVSHIREFAWAKDVGRNFMADIFFPDKNLIVEINGDVHGLPIVKKKDNEKEKLAKELGYNRKVFNTKEVEDDIDKVIKEMLL